MNILLASSMVEYSPPTAEAQLRALAHQVSSQYLRTYGMYSANNEDDGILLQENNDEIIREV
jgi:hypothetical protein